MAFLLVVPVPFLLKPGLTIRWKGLGRVSAFSEGNFLTGFYNLINAVGLALPSPSARSLYFKAQPHLEVSWETG